MTESMRDRAIALARQGFSVFPLAKGTKNQPIVPAGFARPPKGKYHDMIPSSDPDVVARMWTNGHGPREYNIGINTNRLLVVDVDNKNGKDGEAAWRALGFDECTIEARTPTGGRHLFYWLPTDGARFGIAARNTAGNLGVGVDTRGWHGYVVAPGSIVPAGEYTWTRAPGQTDMAPVPPALLARCQASKTDLQKEHAVVPGVELDDEDAVGRAEAWLRDGASEAVEGAAGDAVTYRVACAVKDMGISESACLGLMVTWNADKAHPPWDLGELEQKVANAYAYGTEPIGVNAAEAQFDAVALEQTDNNLNLAHNDKPGTKRALSWCGFTAGCQQALDSGASWLVKGYLGKNEMSVLYGDSNTGKTFIALDIAYHIATGLDWSGRKVQEPELVVYVAAEAGRSIFARLEALRRRYQPTTEPLLVVVPCLVDLFSPNADLKPLLALLDEISKAYGVPIGEVVVDTLARVMGPGDENSAKDMGILVRSLDRIRVDTGGAHVQTVHHSGKNKANGARGSSALRAATDTEIEVEGGQIHMRKQRNDEEARSIGFRLVTVELHKDKDGASVTSCTVELGAAVDFKPPMVGEHQDWVDQLRDVTEMLGLEEFTRRDMRLAWGLSVTATRHRSESLVSAGMILEVEGKETIYRWTC